MGRTTLKTSGRPTRSALNTYDNWKPITLRPSLFISIVAFTTGIIIGLGVLHWQSSTKGGILFSSPDVGFSNRQTFIFRYLPTIIIVVFGILWAWIDLDVKRLEPWYQLSREGGATAEESLLLQYPVDFLPLVPIKAWKKRQWSVFLASTITVCVAWVITPMQNGIFQVSLTTTHHSLDINRSGSLIDLESQSRILDRNFINNAYTTLWLGQSLPPFTTMKYALSPVAWEQLPSTDGSNQTLHTEALSYFAELNCTKASNITISPNATVGSFQGAITLVDEGGCVAENAIPISDKVLSQQFNSAFLSYSNTSLSANCAEAISPTFLAVWKRTTSIGQDIDPSEINAVFCRPSYFVQLADVVISLKDDQVLSVDLKSSKIALSKASFDSNLFENILITSSQPDQARKDILSTEVLHQDTQVRNMSLVQPVSNLVAFAIGTTHFSPQDYLDPENFSTALQSAYQLTFSFAARSIVAPVESDIASSGTITAVYQTVSTVPLFVYIAESFLVIVLILACILFFIMQKRPCSLTCDPGTISELMLMARTKKLRNLCDRYAQSPSALLTEGLSHHNFRLLVDHLHNAPVIEVDHNMLGKIENEDRLKQQDNWALSGKPVREMIKPFEYHKYVGLFVGTLIVVIMAGLIILRQTSEANGLPLPSQNAIVQQIIINLIPSLVATLMEPFWVLLTRVACGMQPLEELRRGDASAQKSLLATYSSLPPQLVAWKAISTGHILLGLLSLVAVVANVVTVALSGIFNVNQVLQPEVASISPTYQPSLVKLNSTDPSILGFNQNDALLVASANFTLGTTLPPWVSPQYYFLPQNLSGSSNNSLDNWLIQMTGYGADLSCTTLSSEPSNATFEFKLTESFNQSMLIVTYQQSNGSALQCQPVSQASGSPDNIGMTSVLGQVGPESGFEIVVPMVSMNFTSAGEIPDPCSRFLVLGWVRAHGKPNSSGPAPNSVPEVTFISCQPKVKSASFDVVLSPEGSILSTNQNSAPQYDPFNNESFNLGLAVDETLDNLLGGSSVEMWHNDTIANDWVNYLIKILNNSTSFLDVSLPPPSPTDAIELASDLFSRIFAIQLSLMTSQLRPASNSSTITAQILHLEPRVTMSNILTWLSIALLSFDLIVVVMFYARTPKPFLPRLPTSIASQVAYFAGSRLVDDVLQYRSTNSFNANESFAATLRKLDEKGWRYAYGKYIGSDGWAHVGIERQPFVQHFDQATENVRKRAWWRKGEC